MLFYTVKDRLCYSCFYANMSKSHNKNDRPFFLVARLQQLMVKHVRKTLNASQCMDTVLQNMNGI